MINKAPIPGLRLVVTREFQAPCPLVFKAWTDPKHMVQWWSPQEVECRSVTADGRVGGAYRIHMVSDEGDHIAYGIYQEFVPHRRIKFSWQWEAYAMPDSVITVDFEDLGKTTRLTLTHEGLPDEEDLTDHSRGWNSALDKFVRLMENHEIKD